MVYKVCELLTTCATRNGVQWRDNMLTTLINEISSQAEQLFTISSLSTQERVDLLCTSVLASKFAVRLHLVTLLFEEMKTGCARAMEQAGLVHTLTDLFILTQGVLASASTLTPTPAAPAAQAAQAVHASPQTTPLHAKDKEKDKDKESTESSGTPKWLSPGLLLLDLYEKLAIATKRRAAVNKICNHVWKWFDMSTQKWCAYSASNNKTINDAYWSGEASIRIINGRRKYTIQFHSMVQVNEESGNRRPVMITIKDKVIAEKKKELATASASKDKPSQAPEEDSAAAAATDEDKKAGTDGQTAAEASGGGVAPASDDAAKAVTMAGGEEKMECEDGEETSGPAAAETAGPEVVLVEGLTDVHQEFMIRACVGFMKLGVDPDTLHALMRLCLRMTRVWENACLFASLGGVRTLLSLTEASGFWGFQNLAALLMRHVLEEPATLRYTMEKSPMESDSSKVPGSDGKGATSDKVDEAAKKKKPLLSKSLICKFLAEFVRSYAGCAKLVTEHHYSAGANEKITEECSALAYMLDHLVCNSSASDKDTAGHVRVLIAALASCNHAPDAQTILVTEVKAALGRATVLVESVEKHSRIQALVGLICIMMEACPAQLNQPHNVCFKQQQHGGHFHCLDRMNNMIRVMVRKGLVTDLARIPHSLDLSSPNMSPTVNAALKPLELVSRIVNLPSFMPTSSSKKKNTQSDDAQQPIGTCCSLLQELTGEMDQSISKEQKCTETTNSEATRAQGDDNIEDTENTEHDISGAGESLEPTSEAHLNEVLTVTQRTGAEGHWLLGPGHREVMQLTSNLRDASQVLFTNPDVRLMPPEPDEFIELQDHGGNVMNNGGQTASLSSVPNALSRWTEETRVLEADSMHDAVTVVKPALMAVLEKYRDEEQLERDKKKKEQETSKTPPASAEISQGPLLLHSNDAEMGEASESSRSGGRPDVATSEAPSQDAAILSTASIAESIVESVLASSSRPQSTTTPSFSGLLTLLSPVSSSNPTLPLQEPPVSSVPAIGGALSGASSAPTTPQTTTVTSLPPFPSPTTTTTIPATTSSTPVASLASTASSLPVTDTEMVTASPLPSTGPQILPSDNVESLATQEETPMSVSPPEYPCYSPQLFTLPEDNLTTPPSPGIPPREAWEDPTMPMQQDSQDQAGESQGGSSLPALVTPARLREGQDAAPESGRENNEAGPSSSSNTRPDYSAILGDIEIPEGVDPSFLAALPEDMRQEVIAEQLRKQGKHN
ncbi:E3 ubiquitin-protein ligase HUWE1 [Portunus trituberculatus]|uniref:E3 ubiquitin-protein ligase HUWE1 n=1 Tax=Portunus trituberculatus TaxID=210409 RepID=A0A5B7CXX1_PORTR|nr:E3 ubiquitin-protein ligase HUWE1 [Portunus trituberculatus]